MSADGWVLDEFRREVLVELGLRPYALARPQAGGATGAAIQALSPELLAALARAGDCAPDAIAALPGLAALPGVAGKRALWPQLRRLRAPVR